MRNWIAAVLAGVLAASAAHAVDFDYHAIVAEDFLAGAFPVRGVDNDGNGMLEEDQLAALSMILQGGAPVACLDASMVAEIQAGFASNLNALGPALTVTVSGVTVNILQQLDQQDSLLGAAVRNLLAGYLTIADNATIVFINNLTDTVIAEYLRGTDQEGQTGNVQNQINFTAAAYATFGDAPGQPNYLGAAGDLDGDGQTNLAEYESVDGDREAWLETQCLEPPLRLRDVSRAGIRITGISLPFTVEVAGGTGNYTFEWRRGTSGSSTLLGTESEYVIPFLNVSDTGSYFAVISDGESSIETPPRPLIVVFLNLIIARPIQGATRPWGSAYTFTVEAAGGAPGPYEYTWRRNGEVVGGNAPSLSIPSLKLEDAGSYTVSVTSDGGGDTRVSGPVTLNVTPPSFSITTHPQSVTRNAGETQVFTVAASGASGNYVYDWRKNGQSLGAPNSPELTLTDLAPGDAGSYDCVVTDATDPGVTQTSNAAELVVLSELLTFTLQPEGAVRAVGESHTFTVEAAGGTGNYNYDWLRDGVSLGGPNAPSLTVDPVLLASAGTYACRVTEAADPLVFGLSNPAELVVTFDDLVIVQQPQGASRSVGASHTFSITVAGGTGNYSYDWRKNGQSLGVASQPSLALNNIQTSDAGAYSCLVTDTVDPTLTALSSVATLNVILPTLEITQQPEGATREQGESHTFTVAAEGGSGSFNYAWRKNGVDIGGAPNASSFTLNNLQSSDTGVYTVIVIDANQPANQRTSEQATLVVTTPGFVVTTQPESAARYVGESYAFTVAVEGGSGNYGYNWRKDGASLSAPNSPTLNLPSLTLGSAGDYDCLIIDQDGGQATTISEVATLTVADPMGIVQQPQGASVVEGSDLVMSVVVQGGLPPLTYTWRRNGTPIPGAPDAALFPIPGVAYADRGAYSVRVDDARSTITSSNAQVEVIIPIPEDGYTLSFPLNGGLLVPPTTSAASGNGVMTLTRASSDPLAGGTVNFNIAHNVQGVTGAALYEGGPGQNGPVLKQFGDPSTPLNYTSAVDAALASRLMAGQAHVRIISVVFPNGDIRGDLLAIQAEFHSADTNQNNRIELGELLRVIQFFNSFGYRCSPGTEDGYAPGRGGPEDEQCAPHSSDYLPQNWEINLSELLRLIQFFNLFNGEYHPDPTQEDGFAPGPPP